MLLFTLHQIMSENKLIACMGSTHKAVKCLRPIEDESRTNSPGYKLAYLFTIVVKDHEVQRGIPNAYMITNTESKYV